MSYLILVRHGKSEWNALSLWTGWKDSPLHKDGKEEAKTTALQLKDLPIDIAYSSDLSRAKETLEIIKDTLHIKNIPTVAEKGLRERNYGILTGKNKWELKKELGDIEFQKIRRGWNCPILEGETLADVYSRVVPFYEKTILTSLKEGKNIIIVAHGNSLRALVKYLENLSDDEVSSLEIGVAEAYVYEVNEKGMIVSKEIRAKNKEQI